MYYEHNSIVVLGNTMKEFSVPIILESEDSMYKMVYYFALASILGAIAFHPTNSLTAETTNIQVVQSNQKEKDKRYEHQEKIKQAKEQWNKLTNTQKEEVYVLLEDEFQAQNSLTDKLVELSVISNEDGTLIKNKRMEEFKK